tara:strand:- start:38 stop:637 length:600 start_codon:yes stop_codon:yes gene_type:complete
MPLYSNTTTGNNQLTYTASEQVTKVLPYDSDSFENTNWTSFKELNIPLGPNQRVIGNFESWYDSNTTQEFALRFRLATPSEALVVADSPSGTLDGNIFYNASHATKVIGANNETLASGGDSGADHVLLNATMYDNTSTVGTKWLAFTTDNSFARYLTLSFKAESSVNVHSQLRLEIKTVEDESADCHLEHGTRITYTKY